MLWELHAGRLSAACNLANGQLVSLKHRGAELLHGGGKPADLQAPDDALGWQNSEIVMFPVIGPVKGDALHIGDAAYPMAQHGISRHLPWEVIEQRSDVIVLRQQYAAGTPVPNTKLPVPLRWPHSFTLEKRISLLHDCVHVTLTVANDGDDAMRYMIGWHPAFRLLSDTVVGVDIPEVQEERAVELATGAVRYGPLQVSSDLQFMTLWSPKGSKLLCIEPMSRLQVWEGLERFTEDDFSLEPGESREHKVEIRIG